MKLLSHFIFIGLALSLCGCPIDKQPMVQLKGEKFSVEIADDQDERVRGLMFRESMDANHGMLFVFDQSAPQSFWMKNCRIPLDIMYFDESMRFVSGHFGVPTCRSENCPSYPSQGDAKYVLELNAGVGRDLNLQVGDVITLPK